jgi:predicted ATPase
MQGRRGLASAATVVGDASERQRRESSLNLRGVAPLERYERLVQEQVLMEDPHQREVAVSLERVLEHVVPWSRVRQRLEPGGSVRQRPSGLYVWGGVGSGKTMLMDMFGEAATARGVRVERSHFNEFMLGIHRRLHVLRQQEKEGVRVRNHAAVQRAAGAAGGGGGLFSSFWGGGGGGGGGSRSGGRGGDEAGEEPAVRDPLAHIAAEMTSTRDVLCFDEFQVTDVGDAMIMQRFFSALWEGGLVVVATSNRPPRDLYLNGLQRELFLPFLDRLQRECSVLRCGSSVDYRMVGRRAGHTWLLSRPALEEVWEEAVKGEFAPPRDLHVQGRVFRVPRAASDAGAAWFTFRELCEQPLGAADYIVLARHFPLIFLSDVPRLSLDHRNAVRRFITLVDSLYNHNCKLFVAAADHPKTLFQPRFSDPLPIGPNPHVPDERAQDRFRQPEPAQRPAADQQAPAHDVDEAFAWDRCLSRIIEMSTYEYLAAPWKPGHVLDEE